MSFESIKKIVEIEYLILDECVSIIHHCNSPTMDKRYKNDDDETPLLSKYTALVNILNKAKRIYCMDADITEEIKTVIEKMFIIPPKTKSFNLLYHTYNDYTFNYYNDKNMIESQINKDINKNLVIVSNRSGYVDTYEKMYKHKVSSFLKITKDEVSYYVNGKSKQINGDKQINKFISNINDFLEQNKPQLLIYPPNISTGVSIVKRRRNGTSLLLYPFSVKRGGEMTQTQSVYLPCTHQLTSHFRGTPPLRGEGDPGITLCMHPHSMPVVGGKKRPSTREPGMSSPDPLE